MLLTRYRLLGVLLLEGVRDVLEQDQAQDDVLVFGPRPCGPAGVSHLPEPGFVADVGGGGIRLVLPA
jgi:hypothetical protein